MIPNRTRLAVAAILAASIHLGGAAISHASQSQQLTIAEGGIDSLTIAIDGSTGSFVVSNGGKKTSYTFSINNTLETFTTNGAGKYNSGTGAFTTSSGSILFSATGTAGTTTFDDYSVNSTINHSQGTNTSSLNDITYDVGKGGSLNTTLTISPSFSFTNPGTSSVVLESDLAVSQITGNTSVTFTSTLGSTTTDPLVLTAKGYLTTSKLATLPGNPYLVSNKILISGMNQGDIASITANTDVNAIATPEPATIGMALIAVPCLLGVYRRRKSAIA